MLDSIIKSLRIESCLSDFISLYFSLCSLLHDYLFGLTWLCQIDEFLMACVWFPVFNEWLSLWYQHGCDMVLASLVLAMCYVLFFEGFVKVRIRHHSLLVWFELSWIMTFFWLRCMIIWRVYMHVRFVVSCGLVLLIYYCVLVSWLWRYLEMESWRLWSVGLMIRLVFKDCGCSLCSVDQIHGGDGLSWRQYIIWFIIGDRDWHGDWVFEVYTVEFELMRWFLYGSAGLFWRTIIVFCFLIGARRFCYG